MVPHLYSPYILIGHHTASSSEAEKERGSALSPVGPGCQSHITSNHKHQPEPPVSGTSHMPCGRWKPEDQHMSHGRKASCPKNLRIILHSTNSDLRLNPRNVQRSPGEVTASAILDPSI